MSAGVVARYPESPCIGVCAIGDDGLCEGCLRSLDEIARWGEMADHERAQIYAALAKRKHGNDPKGSEWKQ